VPGDIRGSLLGTNGQKGQSAEARLRIVPARSENLLTVGEVAERLGICRETIYRLTQRGELACARIGSAVRILPGDLAGYLVRRAEGRQ
jgi:excisionase family DNA binding protein